MITPEEKKMFKILYALSKTGNLGDFEWQWEDLNYNEKRFLEPSTEDFVEDNTYRPKKLKIPMAVVKILREFYIREISPLITKGFEDLLEKVDTDDDPRSEIYFTINTVTKRILAYVEIEYYVDHPESFQWDEDDDINPLLDELRLINPEATRYFLGFDGGGDSGSLDNNIISDGPTNEFHMVPERIKDWCYGNLPGGWEIDNGSRGDFTFDLTENTIQLELTYSASESELQTIYDESFVS